MRVCKLDRTTVWSLCRANFLYVVVVLIVWAVAHPAVRFNITRVIDDNFPGDAGSWVVDGSHANVKLEDTFVSVNPIVATRSLLSKTYPLEQANEVRQYVRIVAEYSGSGSAEQRIGSEERKKRSILYAWFENNNQKRTLIRILASVVDTQTRHELEELIRIPAGSVNINIGLLLRQPTSGIAVHDLVIDQLQQTTFYTICFALFWMAIVLFIVRTGAWVWANNLVVYAMILGLALGVVLAGVLMPGRFTTYLFNSVIAAVPVLNDYVIGSSSSDFQNHGHFIGFFVLALVVLRLAQAVKHDIVDVMAKLFIFAIMAEVLQRHVVSRSFNLTDVLINISGLMLGAICWYWYSQRKNNELA